MIDLFFLAHWRLLRMAASQLWPPRASLAARRWPWRVATLLLVPVFYLYLLYQWLGLLLDELFFRGYRRVAVSEPVFVLGVPRSGTTFVHEVLADDERFTTFSTWECFFAASVSWRKLWSAMGRLDRRCGRPLGRLLAALQRRLAGPFEATHPIRLDAPEEDFFCLLPVLACFILVVPFPDASDAWQLAAVDEAMEPRRRRRLLAYYRSCVQRHLYHHGADRRFLSKNASFAPLVGSLLEAFPDARVIACVRDPVATVSSQLSVLADGLALFGTRELPAGFRDRMIERLVYYHRNLIDHGEALPSSRWQWVTLEDVRTRLAERIAECYEHFGLPLAPTFAARLAERAAVGATWRSRHGHRLEDRGLEAASIHERFAFVYRRFPLGAAPVRGPA